MDLHPWDPEEHPLAEDPVEGLVPVILRHSGWIGLCPIYLSSVTDDCPTVVERRWWLAWWLHVNSFILAAMSSLVPDAHFKIWHVKDLKEPRLIGGE